MNIIYLKAYGMVVVCSKDLYRHFNRGTDENYEELGPE
jgi:hypothetical protein